MVDIIATCALCSKQFKIIDQEQEFFKRSGMPLPTLCPTDRQAKRLAERGERALYRTSCQQCNTNVITSYDPQKTPNKILCKKCFLEYFEKNDVLNQ